MTEAELKKLPRLSASEIISGSQPALLHTRVESAMNIEWWHGYHAALRMLDQPRLRASIVREA